MAARYLFLDVDGVLVYAGCPKDDWVFSDHPVRPHVPAPECIARLNRIIHATGAEVVLSSTWRLFGTIDALSDYFAKHGLAARFVGRTPTSAERVPGTMLWGAKERGHEIQAWLDDEAGPDATFVILDDDDDMAHLSDRLIHIIDGWSEGGLQEHHADTAIAMLRAAPTKGEEGRQ